LRMWSSLPFDYSRMLRFGAVGCLNTALGYTVILGGLALGLGDIASNASGYAAGLVLGFFLNRQWTFNTADGFRSGTLQRYAMIFVVAYGANLAVVIAARSAGIIENPLIHLAGICFYSAIFYFGSVHFVFVAGKSITDEATRTTDEPRPAPTGQFH
jgi:putative flippase GtrA